VTEHIADPDVALLAELATGLAPRYRSGADPWLGSPFEWILRVPSRSKGAIGEQLVADWCAEQGFDVLRSRSSDADRVIHGHRVEIKMSSLWETGIYKFQQIRDQDYDYCFCLGISPFAAHAWLLPKPILLEHVIGHMGQHTGASGRDTAWLSFRPEMPYPWMRPFGGRLCDVAEAIDRLGRGPYG
jgi:hypothetical protein